MQFASAPPRPWLSLAILTTLNVLNMVDRQLLASFGQPITRDLQISLTQLGLLTGLAFVIFYATVGLWLGATADLRQRWRLIGLGVMVWSAATFASGWARGFWSLAAARLVVGVGEAVLTPAAIGLLVSAFAPGRRAMAIGTYYLGAPLGVSLSLWLGGLFGATPDGWRWCFFGVGVLGLPLAAVIIYSSKSSDAGAKQRGQSPWATLIKTWSIMRSSPVAIWTLTGGMLAFCGIATVYFDAIWLQRERGLSARETGALLATTTLIGGTAGSLLGGWLGDRWERRVEGGRWFALAAGQSVLVPCAMIMRFVATDSFWFPLLATIYGGSLTFVYGPLFAAIQSEMPPEVRSSAAAMTVFSINVFGLVPGAFLAGRLADGLSGRIAQPISWSLAAISSLSLSAGLCFLFAYRWHCSKKGLEQ